MQIRSQNQYTKFQTKLPDIFYVLNIFVDDLNKLLQLIIIYLKVSSVRYHQQIFDVRDWKRFVSEIYFFVIEK
jgi:hypothetical protein